MKSSLIRFLTTAASALVLTTAISFADEPNKTEGDKCCPATPEAPKSLIVGHCGTCDKKDKPEVAPAEPAKQEACPSKDCAKCCPATPAAPKA